MSDEQLQKALELYYGTSKSKISLFIIIIIIITILICSSISAGIGYYLYSSRNEENN